MTRGILSQLSAIDATPEETFPYVRQPGWRTKYIVNLIGREKGNVQLSLKVLSNRVGVSKEHLGRAFLADVGLPFRLYLRTVRAREAKRLLRDPLLSVKEIANKLGYSEAANFVRDFRMITGMRPAEYRSSCEYNDPDVTTVR